MADDNVQHGIDDNPSGDAGKGAVLGGLGGAAVGAMAGGPVGAVVGAIAGAIASGAGVAAVDAVDNDNTVSGIGGDNASHTRDINTSNEYSTTLPPHINDQDNNYVGSTSHAEVPVANYNQINDNVEVNHDVDNDLNRNTVGAGVGGVGVGANQVGTTNTVNEDHLRVPIVEEELNVEKHRQQAGEVRVHKEVVSEQVNIPVELEREEVVVTRHAVNRDLRPGEENIGEEVLRVPVTEETVSVSKQAHVVEEVEIGKQTVTEHQTVSDTVRREVVDVDDSTVNTNRNDINRNKR